MKYLGDTFDIHTGGEDNIFPHHENEIAQSESATGKKFIRYWLHCGYLLVEGRKMSKSAGNFFTLKDLLRKGHNPKAIRYLLLSTHYRQQLNFTFEALEASNSAIKRIQDLITALMNIHRPGKYPQIEDMIGRAQSEFERAMDDDLNTAPALAAIFSMVKEVNQAIAREEMTSEASQTALNFLGRINQIIGVLDFTVPESDATIDDLVKRRNEARANKNYALSDEIRDKLKNMGIQIEDTTEGVRWKRVK
jgi:cysteinyl-tRNA synthetase